MEKEFIPYEQALILKQIGYPQEYKTFLNWYCSGELQWNNEYEEEYATNNCCVAPLYQQAFRWLRDNFNFHHYIEPIHKGGKIRYEYCVVNSSNDEKEFDENKIALTYEDAELKCLKELINLK